MKHFEGKHTGHKDIIIRNERNEECRAVEELVRDSFWNVYRPGAMEHYVLHRMRGEARFVRELNFVMEKDGALIGQNVFVRAEIAADAGNILPVLAMGPICIRNDLKRKGYGKLLLDTTLERAAELGFGAVCFEGNIDFYGKSGFCPASAFGIRYHGVPEGEDASFFLAKELIPGYFNGVTGEYTAPALYEVCEREPEAFAVYDDSFPKREKLVLPGQLFAN
ncbi:MAG: N-acetyltransferase [Clostridia bacterium]|nr:N-acetyltransferase [Clostridia bacterium]